VEASKFTEVGYVGRDVESMIRDLAEIAIDMVREERLNEIGERAERNAEERLLDLLMPPPGETAEVPESVDRTSRKAAERLRAGKLDDRMVEVDVKERSPTFEVSTLGGMEEMDINLKECCRAYSAGAPASAKCAWARPWIIWSRKKNRNWWTWIR